MPKYISITPTFNPISLDDYLRVPTMVYTEQQKEIGKLEDYKDKLAYYKALMGNSERAKEIFTNYDDIVNQMTDGVGNYTVGDLQALGRRARSSFRDITSKIDVAVQNRAEQQKRKDKDPTNVGDVGSLETYYYNPDYTPTFVSGKELETGIATAAKQLAQALPYNMEGYVDPAKSKIAISQGYTPDELSAAYAEAINYNATPTSALGKALRQKLDAINYSSLSPSLQRELGASIINGLQGGARQYSVMDNAKYQAPQTTAQYYQGLNAKLTYEANKKAYEETGYIKPPKDSQGWNHVDGPAGEAGEVQSKIYASGAKWTRVRQEDGSWKETYTPAPAAATATTSTPTVIDATTGLPDVSKVAKLASNTHNAAYLVDGTSAKSASKTQTEALYKAIINGEAGYNVIDLSRGNVFEGTDNKALNRLAKALGIAADNSRSERIAKMRKEAVKYLIVETDKREFMVVKDETGAIRQSLGLPVPSSITQPSTTTNTTTGSAFDSVPLGG